MVEQAHQTIGNMLNTGQHNNFQDRWDGILAAVGFAMRATVHTTTCATPMQLVFGKDDIHNICFQANLHYIKERRQCQIIQNNK
jgi:hypothetical protein